MVDPQVPNCTGHDEKLTARVRALAKQESTNATALSEWKVFTMRNTFADHEGFHQPRYVASLPQHAHLFPEFGCYGGRDGKIFTRMWN
jgi:hypothetical protein